MRELSGNTDFNGEEIREGDIVIKTTSLDENKWKYIVKVNEFGEFTIANHFECGGILSMYCNGCWGGPLEVIGNIYDNPKLIEEEISYIQIYRESLRIARQHKQSWKA